MMWAVCSASLQSQNAESMMLNRFRCARWPSGKASASRAGDPRIAPRFLQAHLTNDFQMGSVVSTLPGFLGYRVSARTGWADVSILLLLQRSTAVQVRSSVRLMPQIQPSGGGLLPSPTAWSPDQHLAAMLADVSRYLILGRTEERGLGFGQLARTHTGKCLKCQSSSYGHSDHSALCAGGREWSAGPAPVSRLGQGVPGIRRSLSLSLSLSLSSSLRCTESGEVSWPLCR